jgi:hypothetical protein
MRFLGQTLKPKEFSHQNKVEFPLGATARLIVSKRSGLASGEHEITLRITGAYFGTFSFSMKDTL